MAGQSDSLKNPQEVSIPNDENMINQVISLQQTYTGKSGWDLPPTYSKSIGPDYQKTGWVPQTAIAETIFGKEVNSADRLAVYELLLQLHTKGNLDMHAFDTVFCYQVRN